MQILGGILVLITTSIIGFYIGNIPSNRKRDLLQFKTIINILLSEIKRQTPLKIASSNIAEVSSFPFNKIFKNISLLLETENPKNAFEISMKTYEKNTYLTKEDIMIINNCFSIIGSVDSEVQKNAILDLNNLLDSSINDCNEIASKHKKMYISLGVSFGLLINVLLL